MIRVLIVEDDAPFRRLVARVLRAHAIRVVEVGDGADALEHLAGVLADGGGELPDLVIADVRMRWLTGLHLLAAMHQLALDPPIPTILVTGFAGATTLATAARLGVARVIEKPFDVSLLPGEIARVLGR